ncbi:hypothetical protein K437DRAFT_254464 [Tilletiaria anomala UBC 951]|uniref:Uncharacterized protein n=1 Tax=Tilletiaria anomala (strain ATCC 24038 / CBS 436.72 / UBC 951) TaxID=1037660 RepID=A0A066WEU1_TILAU|nr:uncharacterized protein K437DRAFT_254464 [Tilletiaria anomala UBC 951]KDN52276.1 hypothetical protein K437DRAFT_254464 [Tilletiaria anomala UBC 951]
MTASSAAEGPIEMAQLNGNPEHAQPLQHISLLEALQAFEVAQRRRVAHWKEYHEAMLAFTQGQLTNSVSASNDLAGDTIEPRYLNGNATKEPFSASGPPSNHYDPAPRSIDEGVMTQILRLVTSGLLECSHEVRAIQIELQSQASFNRPDLAEVVSSVQDLENSLLRKIVARDQALRLEALEAGSPSTGLARDRSEDVAEYQEQIAHIKQEIMERMQDISAEIAELI